MKQMGGRVKGNRGPHHLVQWVVIGEPDDTREELEKLEEAMDSVREFDERLNE